MNATELIKYTSDKNKGELLHWFENLDKTVDGVSQELLEPGVEALKKSLQTGDWIDYAVCCKKEGQTHKEIMDKVKKSESWIKKYVNPRLKRDTVGQSSTLHGATLDEILRAKHIHTVINFEIGDLKKATRKFSGWGSVEVKDSQQDKLPIDSIKKIMPTYMQRGSPIMYGHSNRHVGRILKYEIRKKEVAGKEVPGLWLEGLIFNNYKIDDQAWESIQLAEKSGKPVLSLGATPIGVPKYECAGNECFRKFDGLQIYEFTVTDLAGQGQQGANPESTIDKISLAKGQEMDEKTMETDVEKALFGGETRSQVWKPEWGRMQRELPKKIANFDRQLKSKKDDYANFKKQYGSMGKDFQAKMNAFLKEKKARDQAYQKEIQAIQANINTLRTKLASIPVNKASAELAQETATELMKAIDDYNMLTNPFGNLVGGRLLKMDLEKSLPATDDELVDLMLSSCPSCQSHYDSLIKAGTTEPDARSIIYFDLMNALELSKEVYNEMEPLTKEEGADLSQALEQINKGQQQIIALLQKANGPPEEKDEKKPEDKEEDKEKKKADKSGDKEKETKDPKTTPSKEPVLTLSEDGVELTPEQFEERLKKAGYQKVATSPAPGTTNRDLTQGQETKKGKLPTVEESLEVLSSMDMSAFKG
jgi:hypothetical protein